MNWRGGSALIRRSLLSYTASRGFFWTLAVAWMMGPLIYLLVWTTAAKGGTIAGFSRSDFFAYYVILIVVNQLTYPSSNWTVGENIQIGTLSTWLLRPMPAIFEAIASDVALKVVSVPFVAAFSLGLGWLFHVHLAVSWSSALWFALTLCLSQVLRFTFAFLLATMAFWTQRIDALLGLMNTFVFLFAGQVAPVAVLPQTLRRVAAVLPFRYMLGFPAEVLLGKVPPQEMMPGMLWQAGWTLVVLVLAWITWRRGVRSYSAVGG